MILPQIRRAGPGDAALLCALAERTFRDTFTQFNSAQDMAAHCAQSYSEAIQRAELQSPSIQTLLLESDGGALGYAQLRSAHVPACVGVGAPIELWRFYIASAGIGRGLAQTLMAGVIAAAIESGARTLWLGVWEHNPRAIAFYRKFGFRDVGAHAFHLGADRQTDLILLRELAATN